MWHPARGLPVAGAVVAAIAFAVQAMAATQPPTTYTVNPNLVSGVNTGLVLKKRKAVTVTATGTVCPGMGWACVNPDGNPAVNTASNGFLLPNAPAFGLVARIGSGSWTHVGSGPTKLSGAGDLVLAFNDNVYGDNVGAFVVTVSYGAASQQSSGCQPGKGTGDKNHTHDGPPGQGGDACYPGHGYGDKNHTHDGPPGQNNDPPGQNNGSDEHGKPSK
jgi:hypothetical protein